MQAGTKKTNVLRRQFYTSDGLLFLASRGVKHTMHQGSAALAVYITLGVVSTILIIVAVTAGLSRSECTVSRCSTSAECTAAVPRCDTQMGVCGPCTGDADCADQTGKPECNTRTGACEATTACTATSCTAVLPKCNAQTGVCGKCTADRDCGHQAGKPKCNTGTGACEATAACTAMSCTAALPKCNAQTGVCEKCTADPDCAHQAGKAKCNTRTGACKAGGGTKALGSACASPGECASVACTGGFCVFADTQLCGDGKCAKCGIIDPSKAEWAKGTTLGTCTTGSAAGNNPGCFSVAGGGASCSSAPGSQNTCGVGCPCYMCPGVCASDADCSTAGSWPAGTKCRNQKCVTP